MSIIQGNAKQGSTRGFYDFPLEQSLRFNDDDSAYLSWTPSVAGTSGTTFTISVWFKISSLSPAQDAYLFSAGSPSTSLELFYVLIENATNDLRIQWRDQGSSTTRVLQTSRRFRDPTAWYHLVISVDTTASTASDRMKVYINGELETSFSTDARSTLSGSSSLAATAAVHHTIGAFSGDNARFWDGYMAEVNFIDGTAYDASSFGELKNGVWIPKDPTGLTYGTNGFRLSFADDAEVEAFNTVLYRGNGGTQDVTGFGFQPDLVWIKSRSIGYQHSLYDAVRGTSVGRLASDQTAAEVTNAPNNPEFISDGIQVKNVINDNASGQKYVAWGWKAGDSNVSNTDGSIASTVRANTTYGFSIVSYTANATNGATVGHGLDSAPDMVIYKNRDDGAYSWIVYHVSLGPTKNLRLDSTTAQLTQTLQFNDTAPSASVLTLGSSTGSTNGPNGDNYIAYCWAEKAGYSKFGSYSGGTNPNTITTGFKPAVVIFKNTTTASNWLMLDNTRDVVAPQSAALYPNLSNAELDISSYNVEFTDTGFILQNATTDINSSGDTFIYAAFADTREAAFWLDQSGNDNDWQPVNLDHNDTVADSPTDNFCTLNPLELNYVTLSDGNLVVQESAGSWRSIRANFMMASGQWYWEFEATASASNYFGGGISRLSEPLNNYVGGSANGYGILAFNGNKYNSGAATAFTSAFTVGDVIGVAFDADAGTLEYYKNGTSIGTAFTGLTSGDFFPAFTVRSSTVKVNFGQQPFKYDPPA